MTLFLKLAWRNTLRNKRRTFITSIAIGLGLASLIYVDALMLGMNENMIESGTASFLGEGQIHSRDFRHTLEAEKTIQDLSQVLTALKKEPIVKHFTARTLSFGMITSPANVSAISLAGVDPNTEKHLSEIHKSIILGSYFKEDQERNIVIGSKLAEILEIRLGERVVVTVAQAHSGELSQEMFKVSGIYHINMDEMDRGMAFIHIHKAQAMLGIGQEAHEIALKFIDSSYGQNENLPFWDTFSANGNEALSWTKLMPQLKAAMDLVIFSILITGLILFSINVLVIINSLFMSLYERMFEFGVLRAIGTKPLDIAKLIIFEAGTLALISISIGTILGLIVTFIFQKTGINYTGIEYAGVTFRKLIYPVLTVKQFIIYPLWVFISTLVAAIYPAVYAARMSIVEAMRKSL